MIIIKITTMIIFNINLCYHFRRGCTSNEKIIDCINNNNNNTVYNSNNNYYSYNNNYYYYYNNYYYYYYNNNNYCNYYYLGKFRIPVSGKILPDTYRIIFEIV